MINLFRDLLILLGRPVYYLFLAPYYLFLYFLTNNRTKVTLKSFLKSIYPLINFLSQPRPIPRLHLQVFRWSLYLLLLLSTIGFIGLYTFVLKDLPNPSSLEQKPFPLTTHIRDRQGRELFKIYKSENRTLIKLSDIPQSLINATVSIEDADFYTHKGFSPRGILRALFNNMSCVLSTLHCDLSIQGGSTITQQLVKTALLSPERTIQRKLKELVLAVWVETIYSKSQILEMYLNRVGYGGSLYGVEEASQAYFGIPSKQLSLGQSAFLAGLPAAPTTYSPYGSHPELAVARQAEVLSSMVKNSFLTWEEADSISGKAIQILPPKNTILAPHFVMYIRELLAQKYGSDVVDQGGLDVITSLDLDIQNAAQLIVTSETAKVAYLRVGNGAVLVTNPQTGEILAMVGSRDYFDLKNDGNVNVTLSHRQPGSSIKPINYALALSRGFTPASVIEDSPITYRVPGLPPYSPVNYDRRYHGRLSLRSALANSYNIPAVKILAANGVSAMIDLAQKMGISTWTDRDRFGLSLTLGGGEVTMTDMGVAYGVFANLGRRVDLHPILSVRNSTGHLLEEFRCDATAPPRPPTKGVGPTEITSCSSESVLDPKVTYLISSILSDNVARTPVFGPRSDLFVPGQAIAAKTGTTNDLRDNWTIGYTSDRVVVVWVGNNDNSPMSYVASGVTGASPIWRKVMDNLLKSNPHPAFSPPSDLLKLDICIITGELACGPICPTKTEYFIPGTQPKHSCNPEAIKKIFDDRAKKAQEERDKLLNGTSTDQ